MTNTKLTAIRLRHTQACDELDRAYRLIASYVEDAERERGFMLDESGYGRSDEREADEVIESLAAMRREVGTVLGIVDATEHRKEARP